jgi:outer membrane protein assembly factor BamD (BamD/ComL family)
MDPAGTERWRLEGYLPRDEFRAFLEMGLARVAFTQKNFADAERRYADVVGNYPNSTYAPESLYWRGVSRYSGSHEATALGETAQELTEKYPDNQWAMRSLPWLPAKESAA